jgi:nucleotide-binding universal stress UspA family protein
MFDRVIVPLDGSSIAESALGPAADVVRETGAALVPMMVVHDQMFEDHARYLKERTADLDVELRPPYILVADDPGACISNAGEAPRSLVVMTTHGRTGWRRTVLGSVAEKVVRTATAPVLLVGPNCADPPRLRGGKAVVPVDGSPRSEAIVPVAAEWCRALDMEAWSLEVVIPDAGAEGPLAEGDVTEGNYPREVAQTFETAGIRSGWDVVHAPTAGEAIVDYAAALPASLLALATHGRSGLDRVAMGSVTSAVVHDATCPVLVQRPTGRMPR